jgi:4-aminobutyrate aminotransferase/(S)-3-amino-2-methylpropionate transaminase
MMMVADEIQCGFGRTGKLFAVEHYGVIPDLMTTGKSLAAGTPLAAVTGRAEVMDGPHPGGLGGTYSGSPLACAAAAQAIRLISEPAFLERAVAVGQRFRRHLEQIQRDCPLVGDVRGVGPMLAIEFVQDRETKTPTPVEFVGRITAETLKRGLITIRAGLYSNCLRFLPPLTLTDAEIDEGMAIVADAVHIATRDLMKK